MSLSFLVSEYSGLPSDSFSSVLFVNDRLKNVSVSCELRRPLREGLPLFELSVESDVSAFHGKSSSSVIENLSFSLRYSVSFSFS